MEKAIIDDESTGKDRVQRAKARIDEYVARIGEEGMADAKEAETEVEAKPDQEQERETDQNQERETGEHDPRPEANDGNDEDMEGEQRDMEDQEWDQFFGHPGFQETTVLEDKPSAPSDLIFKSPDRKKATKRSSRMNDDEPDTKIIRIDEPSDDEMDKAKPEGEIGDSTVDAIMSSAEALG